jgi:hypothetical protein
MVIRRGLLFEFENPSPTDDTAKGQAPVMQKIK